MKKFLVLVSIFSILIVACKKEDDTVSTNVTSPINTTPTDTSQFNNSYMFSDDKVECFPLFGNPTLNSNGIISIISQPCSNSGSKFDGYFKWNTRPNPGTYQIVGNIGAVPIAFNLGVDQFSVVFYGHGQSTLYSVGGTVEVSKNGSDTSKLDLNWKNIDMAFAHDSSVIQFSGNLNGL